MVALTARETSLWAKKSTEEGEQYWLPLAVHLIDTSHVINWLFLHWLDEGQRLFLEQSLSEESLQKLIKFLGFFHDFGKATPAFQTKASYDGNRSLDGELIDRLNRHGFADLTDLVLASPQKSPHALAGEALLESKRFRIPQSVGAIIGGHHGKAGNPPRHQIRDYTANYFQVDGHSNDSMKEAHRQELAQSWQDAQQRLFDYGLALAGYQNAEEIPEVSQPEAVLLEGLLIMADWLASSEYLDNSHREPLFPLIRVDQSFQDVDLLKRYQNGILTWKRTDKWEPREVQLTNANGPVDPYFERWGFRAHHTQLVMTKAIQDALDPGMVVVEAGMGSGKTEVALLAAEELAYKTGRNGVYMGLPTQATSNAMFERFLRWAKQLADQEGKQLSIDLAHSKSAFNLSLRALPRATNVYDRDELVAKTPAARRLQGKTGATVVDSWLTGKKEMLNDFIVGTIDNLLLMGLKKKHLFLRHLGFSGKVVILDEVHAYDTYMTSYLERSLNWLGAYHVPVILLSATLPVDKRNVLLRAYLRGKYGRRYQSQLVAPADWETAQAYPLLTILDGSEIKQTTKFGPTDGVSKNLRVQRLNLPDTELATAILQKIQDGGVAGVIVNTVRRAQELTKLILDSCDSRVEVMLLHSAYLAPDRAKQERELQAKIGKNGQRPNRLVVVGTQVLEQSLDIDFDVLYTDIAPMDLILQRAGRLHRHAITRPKELQNPEVFIMGIQGLATYDAGDQAVYGQYLLMKTDHFLGDTIRLPEDISPLVQKVYSSSTDAEVKKSEQAQADGEVNEFEQAQADFAQLQCDSKKKAKVFQIAKPNFKPDATIHSWLDNDYGDLGKDGQKASAAVRDIQESLEVILVKCTNQGAFLLDGRPIQKVASREIAEQVIRIPVAITAYSSELDAAITELEKRTQKYFAEWQLDPWLRGDLALPLDDHLSTTLGRWRLTYSSKLGLSYAKEDDYD
ncbi:CRISPR-associated helicase/endonuclease Cas3 [Levilactobacillus namurensis]|nr:CRISPR-associated helicase/endonuclease Cas3 [Levilactobacillus namurensis]GEO73303.1 CRISPR-associated helicase/endonuclease Cas3 [Levilactobacillus namurensis]